LQRIEKQLSLLHEKLNGLSHYVDASSNVELQTSPRFPIPCFDDGPSPASHDGSQARKRAFNPGRTSHESPQSTIRQSLGEVAVARPNLLTFCCPPFLSSASTQWEGWDDTEFFYDEELQSGEEFAKQSQAALLRPVDLSRRTTQVLQQSFVENFLRWLPICDLQDCVGHVAQAYACNFDTSNSSSCFAMLLFAIGAIANGSIQSMSREVHGVDYFSRGSLMLDGMAVKTGCLVNMQCRLLQAAYFEFSIHPLLAWNSISQVSRDCMHILSSSRPRRLERQQRDILQRVFWSCSIIMQ
jgi:hypothetical protein